MPWGQWWYWILILVFGISVAGIIGGTLPEIIKALRGGNSSKEELRQIKAELGELRAQLSEGRMAQKALELQKCLSAQELQCIQKQTLPQGVAVILFSDIEGFTAHVEQQGDQAAYQLLQHHQRIVQRSAERHGGLLLKQLGDGFMVSFSSAKQALLCAAQMQSQLADDPLRVRIGLHAGEPIHEGQDFIGRTVNLAERIMDQAQGGQIFTSEVIKDLAGPLKGFQYLDQGPRRLQGITELQHLYQFQPIAALAYPLDSTVDQALATLEQRLKEENS
ncbi:MAG TPA: adenylate/guanylate cyclase domain-containing protein [Candidatus Fraserbacteria bacterium]|nr:adenylate/guanylate cyclase domain-containing protein [Candidatus Fraserbacteria bacterium]